MSSPLGPDQGPGPEHAPEGYPAPGQPYGGPAGGAPTYGADPYAGQQQGAQPYPNQPYPNQPYLNQPYPNQPYGPSYPSYPGHPGAPGYGQVYPRNDLAVWSLVLALAGVALGFTLLTGIPAIVLGRRARQAVARGEANNDGIATAGIVVGWIATALGVLVVVGVLVALVLVVATSSSSHPY